MKKLFYLVCMLSVAFACKKENNNIPFRDDEAVGFKKLPVPINQIPDLISCSSENESVLLKEFYHYSSLIFEQYVKNKEKLKIITDALLENPKNELSFYSINAIIADKYKSEKSKNIFVNSQSTSCDTAFIYLYNSKTCNQDLPPVFAIGIELDDVDATLEDYIPAWKMESDGSYSEVAINEKLALNLNTPLFIITMNQYDSNQKINESIYSNKKPKIFSPNEVNACYERYFIDSYQINYRYERSGKSEYRINYIVLESGIENSQVDFNIAKVKKKDIGKAQYTWVELTNNRYNSAGQLIGNQFKCLPFYSIIGVTFEYDWYASKKSVIVAGRDLQVRMTGTNDFYQRINTSIDMPNGGILAINEKGFIRFHRND